MAGRSGGAGAAGRLGWVAGRSGRSQYSAVWRHCARLISACQFSVPFHRASSACCFSVFRWKCGHWTSVVDFCGSSAVCVSTSNPDICARIACVHARCPRSLHSVLYTPRNYTRVAKLRVQAETMSAWMHPDQREEASAVPGAAPGLGGRRAPGRFMWMKNGTAAELGKQYAYAQVVGDAAAAM